MAHDAAPRPIDLRSDMGSGQMSANLTMMVEGHRDLETMDDGSGKEAEETRASGQDMDS